jgi:hypothetical protein
MPVFSFSQAFIVSYSFQLVGGQLRSVHLLSSSVNKCLDSNR